MRPIVVGPLSANGNSIWIPLNRLQIALSIALAGIPSSGASLIWAVQHTFDDLSSDSERQVQITRAGTVATLVDAVNPHGLSVGDSLIIMGSGSTNLDGTYDVASVVDANTVTYTVVNTGATASNSGTRAKYLRVFPHATLTGQTGRADGNYAFPPTACRFVISGYASGSFRGEVVQGMGN